MGKPICHKCGKCGTVDGDCYSCVADRAHTALRYCSISFGRIYDRVFEEQCRDAAWRVIDSAPEGDGEKGE